MTFGQWGEEQAYTYLKGQGYRILERNFRCRTGELDIVAQRERTLCFVEVKSRRSTAMGWPGEAVTVHKQRRIRSAAAFYMHRNAFATSKYTDLRLDVVEVLCLEGKTYIRHIENAF